VGGKDISPTFVLGGNEMMYVVYSGEYPFNEVIGTVFATHFNPEAESKLALDGAILQFGGHPVVELLGE
jgi:hypothetical protein